MINTLEQFGRNAGKVWSTLKEKGSLSESDILEKTSLRPYEFYIAVGWLAKENKIRRDGEFYKLDVTNLTNEVGENAGKIWKILFSLKEIEILNISKIIKIDDKEIYSAIGWLARENKIRLKIGQIQNQIKSILNK